MMPETTYNLVAKITLFPTEEGGRKKPVLTGYRPSFAFNTKRMYSGEIELLDKEVLRPGETSTVFIKLLPASTIRKTLKPNDAFIVAEGAKTIGTGVIEKVERLQEQKIYK